MKNNYPFDDDFGDIVMDKVDIRSKNINSNNKNRFHRHNHNKRDEVMPLSRGLTLVNRDKFKAIHKQHFNLKPFDEYMEDMNQMRKSDKLVNNNNNRKNETSKERPKSFSNFPKSVNEIKGKLVANKEPDMKSMDSKTRFVSKLSTDSIHVPDEQEVHVSEDDWTFKDLDLWAIR